MPGTSSLPLSSLAAAFRRRGMRDHVQALVRGSLPSGLLLEWCRTLRVPPHDQAYPLLARGAPCPKCGTRAADRTATGTRLVFSFPGGWSEQCTACRAVWLHEERY